MELYSDKGVGQTKDVVIYDRSISRIFEDAVIGEYSALQIINSFIIIVKFNGASPLLLPICMTFIFTVK